MREKQLVNDKSYDGWNDILSLLIFHFIINNSGFGVGVSGILSRTIVNC